MIFMIVEIFGKPLDVGVWEGVFSKSLLDLSSSEIENSSKITFMVSGGMRIVKGKK